jgi:hypothetical protein
MKTRLYVIEPRQYVEAVKAGKLPIDQFEDPKHDAFVLWYTVNGTLKSVPFSSLQELFETVVPRLEEGVFNSFCVLMSSTSAAGKETLQDWKLLQKEKKYRLRLAFVPYPGGQLGALNTQIRKAISEWEKLAEYDPWEGEAAPTIEA